MRYDLDVTWSEPPTPVPSRVFRDVANVYELLDDWTFSVHWRREVYEITVPKGYQTDGPSLPWWVPGLKRLPGLRAFYIPVTSRTWPAGVAHDCLYCFQGFGVLPRYAQDLVYTLACAKRGVHFDHAALMFRALKLFGGGAYREVTDLDKFNQKLPVVCQVKTIPGLPVLLSTNPLRRESH